MNPVRWLALALLVLAGCPAEPDGAYCGEVRCFASDVCADTEECLAPDEVHAVTVHWTIEGTPPDAARCATMGEITLGIYGASAGDLRGYRPIACTAGQFPFNDLPLTYDSTSMYADAVGITVYADIPPQGGDVTIDLPAP